MPCHKIFVKCLATSCVGSVINVKIDVNLQDIILKCLGYLLSIIFYLFSIINALPKYKASYHIQYEHMCLLECDPM